MKNSILYFAVHLVFFITAIHVCLSQTNYYHKRIVPFYTSEVEDVVECANGDIAFVGTMYQPTGRCMIFGRNDFYGHSLFIEKYINIAPGYCSGYKLLEMDNGGFILGGLANGPETHPQSGQSIPKMFLKAVDSTGSPQWERSIINQYGVYYIGGIFKSYANRYFAATGYAQQGSTQYCQTLDGNGSELAYIRISSIGPQVLRDFCIDEQENKFLVVDHVDSIHIHRIDSLNQHVWTKTFNRFATPEGIIAHSSGIFILMYDAIDNSSIIMKLDYNGNYTDGRKLSSQTILKASRIIKGQSPYYFLAGNQVDSDGYFILKMDTALNVLLAKKYFENGAPLNLPGAGLTYLNDGGLLSWGNDNGLIFSRLDSSCSSLCIQDSLFTCQTSVFSIPFVSISDSVYTGSGPTLGLPIITHDYSTLTQTTGCQLLSTTWGSYPQIVPVVYPNPSYGLFAISGLPELGITEYTVTDMFGREISRGQYNCQQQLDFTGFGEGIYFLKLKQPVNDRVLKIMINR